MTTPLPSPTPFAELLKIATPGPVSMRQHRSFWSLERALSAKEKDEYGIPPEDERGMSILAISYDDFACIEKEADAELICRLLSWAHAGGVETIKATLDKMGLPESPASTDDGCYTNDPVEKAVRASLALLDGKK